MESNGIEKFASGVIFGFIVALSMTQCSEAHADSVYFDVGVGYKLQEAKMLHEYHGQSYTYDDNNSPTAHLALGYNFGNGLNVELSHDSNWLNGWPVNDNWEYHRTEVRIVKRFGG